MKVRLTVTVEPPFAVVDSVGEVVDIELHPEDAQFATEHGAVQLLRHLPLAVVVKLENEDVELLPPEPCAVHSVDGPSRQCPQCRWFPGHILVKPQESRTFTVEVTTQAVGSNQDLTYQVKVKRVQIPLAIVTASTLHELQGTTTDAGMIFHWKFLRRLTKEMR